MSGDAGGWAELLHLDAARVARVAARTRQWAHALDEAGRSADDISPGTAERKQREAAALYALAASYALLAAHDTARLACRQAAGHFYRLGSSYAHPFAVCADDQRTLRTVLERPPADRAAPSERLYEMTALAWLDVTSPEHERQLGARDLLRAHRKRANLVRPLPAGNLRLPLGATTSVLIAAVAVAADGPGQLGQLAASVRGLLLRADEVVATAMLDRYHWGHLMSSVMPVEPEILAPIAIAIEAAERATRSSDGPVLDELLGELPPSAVVSLEVAHWIARSS
jgi:hypothetical protein